MKLFGKMTLLTAGLALIATTASLGVLSVPVMNGSVRAATSITSGTNGIELNNYTKSYKLGATTNFTDSETSAASNGYLLPEVTAGTGVNVTAKNRVGVTTSVRKGTDNKYYLVTSSAGIYNITYSVTDGD